jgi:hypothetical protein
MYISWYGIDKSTRLAFKSGHYMTKRRVYFLKTNGKLEGDEIAVFFSLKSLLETTGYDEDLKRKRYTFRDVNKLGFSCWGGGGGDTIHRGTLIMDDAPRAPKVR